MSCKPACFVVLEVCKSAVLLHDLEAASSTTLLEERTAPELVGSPASSSARALEFSSMTDEEDTRSSKRGPGRASCPASASKAVKRTAGDVLAEDWLALKTKLREDIIPNIGSGALKTQTIHFMEKQFGTKKTALNDAGSFGESSDASLLQEQVKIMKDIHQALSFDFTCVCKLPCLVVLIRMCLACLQRYRWLYLAGWPRNEPREAQSEEGGAIPAWLYEAIRLNLAWKARN
jgi:hypothetical protein